MDPVELTNGQLLLRPPGLADVPRIYEACQDPEMVRWTTVPSPYEKAHAVGFVEEYAAGGWLSGTLLVWAIVADRDGPHGPRGDYLGAIDLRLDGSGAAEIGYAVAPWARGRGVATAAVGLVCRWGFADLGLGRIQWLAHIGNEASRRVADKAGFRYEGVSRARCVARGERVDAWVAALLPGDLPDLADERVSPRR